jgi:NAD(P)-dependent dehydrogenase (short-subunit alcohol dehydrogenase family)
MRILLVGATGTIGRAVTSALEARGHDVVQVGASRGDLSVDLGDAASIERLYASAGAPVDAVVCAAGIARFGPLADLTDEDFRLSVANKLMGQVNLVRRGLGVVTEGGSFTLTSGDLSQKPAPAASAVIMAGAGLEAFARAAALDLRGRYRVNVVSPAWVAESRVSAGLDPMPGIWAKDLAAYYVDFVENAASGVVANADRPLQSR